MAYLEKPKGASLTKSHGRTEKGSIDKIVIIAMEAILVILFGLALIEDGIIWYRLHHMTSPVHAGRGDQSMTILYYIYGGTLSFYSLLIQAADSLKGKKVLIIVLNLIVLSYLFLLSPWFRNSLLFPVLIAIKRDF